MTSLQTLIAARELISEESRWTQGQYARDSAGHGSSPMSKTAVCFCSEGAILRVTREPNDVVLADRLLRKATGEPTYVFNDTRTHTEVLAAFDRAIELAKEEAA